MTCKHENMHAHVNVIHLEDSGATVAECKIHCQDCGVAFRFLGLPNGYNRKSPTVSMDGLEANFPIEPIDGSRKRNPNYDGVDGYTVKMIGEPSNDNKC